MKTRIWQLEEKLTKLRPPSLTHLHRALSDTFPPLRSFHDTEREEEEEISLNSSLLRGLREIEEREKIAASGVAPGDSEEAGLPIGGDLPTELAGGECEGVTVVKGEEEGVGEGVTDVLSEKQQTNLDEPAKKTCPTIVPSYATAVSNPFHPAMKGLSPVSDCFHSIPVTQQSSMPHMSTVHGADPITMATISMETSTPGHHGNNTTSGNSHLPTNTMAATDIPPPPGFKAGQRPMSRDAQLAVPLSNILEDGFGGLACCRSTGWGLEWREPTPSVSPHPAATVAAAGVTPVVGSTPRSNSALSVLSSSSSGECVSVCVCVCVSEYVCVYVRIKSFASDTP